MEEVGSDQVMGSLIYSINTRHLGCVLIHVQRDRKRENEWMNDYWCAYQETLFHILHIDIYYALMQFQLPLRGFSPGAYLTWNLVTSMENLRGMIKTQNIALYTELLNSINVRMLNWLQNMLEILSSFYSVWNLKEFIYWYHLLEVIVWF